MRKSFTCFLFLHHMKSKDERKRVQIIPLYVNEELRTKIAHALLRFKKRGKNCQSHRCRYEMVGIFKLVFLFLFCLL